MTSFSSTHHAFGSSAAALRRRSGLLYNFCSFPLSCLLNMLWSLLHEARGASAWLRLCISAYTFAYAALRSHMAMLAIYHAPTMWSAASGLQSFGSMILCSLVSTCMHNAETLSGVRTSIGTPGNIPFMQS